MASPNLFVSDSESSDGGSCEDASCDCHHDDEDRLFHTSQQSSSCSECYQQQVCTVGGVYTAVLCSSPIVIHNLGVHIYLRRSQWMWTSYLSRLQMVPVAARVVRALVRAISSQSTCSTCSQSTACSCSSSQPTSLSSQVKLVSALFFAVCG